MTKEEIEARFAALDEKMAAVDAQLAVVKESTDQIWMRMIMDKLNETGKTIDDLAEGLRAIGGVIAAGHIPGRTIRDSSHASTSTTR